MTEWQRFVQNEMRLGGYGIPSPKLICIDLQPYNTVQALDRDDILDIGGFIEACTANDRGRSPASPEQQPAPRIDYAGINSDAVFVVAAFFAEDSGRFVAEVEAVEL